MNKNIIIAILIVLVFLVFFIIKNDEKVIESTDPKNTQPEQIVNNINTYKSISSSELEDMLKNKDFTLIDVHIPEQRHIPGTDYVIPFNQIDKIESVLKDKNQKVVLYCRSGGMSKVAADNLVKKGYKNVYELKSGLNEWVAEGKETLPQGSIK